MLAGIDDADGPSRWVAKLLRELAVAREEQDGYEIDEVGLLHDGEVDEDGVKVVPFLLELIAEVPVIRRPLIKQLSGIVSPLFETPGRSERARRAVLAGIDAVVPLVTDPEPEVRAFAYLVLGWSGGPADVLWPRNEDEFDLLPGAALMLALGAADPDRAAPVLARALTRASPAERLTAALALHRAGLDFPAGAGAALAEAVVAGVDLTELPVLEPLPEIVGETTDEAFVAEFLAAALRPDAHDVDQAIYALSSRCESHPDAAGRYLPLLRPILAGDNDEARGTALHEMKKRGAVDSRPG